MDELPPVTYLRLPGRRPMPEGNRYGASTMEGYVPDIDATVVTRILDAGGTIAGKTVCEYFCFSGSSHTSASGPVHNPHRIGYSAGGSSSAVLPSSLRARCRWHWAAIRAARSVSRPRSAGFMD